MVTAARTALLGRVTTCVGKSQVHNSRRWYARSWRTLPGSTLSAECVCVRGVCVGGGEACVGGGGGGGGVWGRYIEGGDAVFLGLPLVWNTAPESPAGRRARGTGGV